jgi:hypothetical protein
MDTYCLGRAMVLQAGIWHGQGQLKEAKAEILCALETFEKLGATGDLERCRDVLRNIELATERSSIAGEPDGSGEFSGDGVASYIHQLSSLSTRSIAQNLPLFSSRPPFQTDQAKIQISYHYSRIWADTPSMNAVTLFFLTDSPSCQRAQCHSSGCRACFLLLLPLP